MIDPIPIAICKLQQLRHLYFSKFKAMIIGPTYNTTFPNLHTLQGICICESTCIVNGLDNLVNLRELGLYGDPHLQTEEVANWIHKNKNLEELKIQATSNLDYYRNAAIPEFMSFSCHIRLYKLHLEGFISKMLDIKDFPPNLIPPRHPTLYQCTRLRNEPYHQDSCIMAHTFWTRLSHGKCPDAYCITLVLSKSCI